MLMFFPLKILESFLLILGDSDRKLFCFDLQQHEYLKGDLKWILWVKTLLAIL